MDKIYIFPYVHRIVYTYTYKYYVCMCMYMYLYKVYVYYTMSHKVIDRYSWLFAAAAARCSNCLIVSLTGWLVFCYSAAAVVGCYCCFCYKHNKIINYISLLIKQKQRAAKQQYQKQKQKIKSIHFYQYNYYVYKTNNWSYWQKLKWIRSIFKYKKYKTNESF